MRDVTVADIEEAYEKIKETIRETTLEYSRNCSQIIGTNVYLKFENQQLTGSFKIRGALNKMLNLTPQERSKGVIASSAGNHAQGLAYSSKLTDVKAKVVMPETSPMVKVMATQGYGAEVILNGQIYDDAYHHAVKLAKEEGYTFVHPYKDPDIIAGQGTLGLEVLKQLPQMDSIIVPIGGGGLISGIAKYVKTVKPSCKVYGVVPERFEAMRTMYKHEENINSIKGPSIADGTAVKAPDQEIYEQYISKYVDDIMSVSEKQIAQSMVFLLERAKSVVEGSGALALAAVFNTNWDLGENCCLLLSGGNVDLNLITKVIEQGLTQSGRLARLKFVIDDYPGNLSRVTQFLADEKVNILDVFHTRVGVGLELRETMVELLIETRGLNHLQDTIDHMEESKICKRRVVVDEIN